MFRRILLIITICVLPVSCMAETYSGSLTNEPDSTGYQGIIVSDGWSSTDYYETLTWTVGRDSLGDPYHYRYELYTGSPSSSHFMIEVTGPDDPYEGGAFIDEPRDFFNYGVYYLDDNNQWVDYTEHTDGTQAGQFTTGGSNQGLPEDFYALKWDAIAPDEDPDFGGDAPYTLAFEFDSWRQPVWGDIYGKSTTTDYFYNVGFGEPDPSAPPSNGSIDGNLLVPNGSTPAPTSLILVPITLAGVSLWRRRRRR